MSFFFMLQEFSLPLIYKLFQQPHTNIKKLAVDVIENLVIRCKEENVQELFRNSGGLQEMLGLLEVNRLVRFKT